MKQLLTIAAILFSVTLLAQNPLKGMTDTTCILCPSLNFKDDGKSPLVWNGLGIGIKSEQIGVIRSSGKDTLDITYPALIKNNHLFKYIKVGNKLFKEVDLNEFPNGNFGFNGRFFGAKPLILTNNGYAIAEPARTPIIDTVKWIAPFKRADTTSYTTPKIVCRRIVDSLYYKTPKPIKNNTKKANKNKKQ